VPVTSAGVTDAVSVTVCRMYYSAIQSEDQAPVGGDKAGYAKLDHGVDLHVIVVAGYASSRANHGHSLLRWALWTMS
jgi:hypothetical protein